MKKLEIEIPDNKEVDWEASTKQKQIVLKDKQLTYEDVCTQMFASECWYLDSSGNISCTKHPSDAKNDPNNATTEHQLKCVLAKNMLANVARYLNGEWTKEEQNMCPNWTIFFNDTLNEIVIGKTTLYSEQTNVLFKYKELAQQAIEILGKETIKLAVEPLY